MGKAVSETYTNAGFLKKAGTGLVMDLAGAEFFLYRGELDALNENRKADIVNVRGEPEGLAYLSPVAAQTKSELTGIISRRIYVVPYRRFCRVVAGSRRLARIMEYHPPSGRGP